MAVTDSPFAALQLVGLMFPVVVLTLRAYTDMFSEQDKRDIQFQQEIQVQIKKASQAAIVSLLFFIISAMIVLGGTFTDGTQVEPYILPAWASTTLGAFGAYLALVYFWYQKITDMATVELI